jgi:hypothetical protein
MAEAVIGSFAFTVLDENNTIYFIKGSSPLYLIYFEKSGLYAYASTKTILDKALKQSGLNRQNHSVIQVSDGDIISIDKNGEVKCDKFEFDDFRSLYSGYHYSAPEFYSSYSAEELLLEICSCFGVDEDDVMMLLDYGYSAEEIEEMLMDTDMLEETVRELRSVEEWEDILEFCR